MLLLFRHSRKLPSDSTMKSNFVLPKHRLVSDCILAVLLTFLMLLNLPATAGAQVAGQGDIELKIGIGGNAKLGKWLPIFIKAPAGSNPKKFEIEVLDGDDTPVKYVGDLLIDDRGSDQYQALVRIGRTFGMSIIRLLDDSDNVLFEKQIELRGATKVGEFQRSTRSIFMTYESGDEIKKLVESVSAFNADGETRVVVAQNKDALLPVSRLGYDSVDLAVMVTSDMDRMSQLTTSNVDAIEGWVREGGTLIISSAKNSEALLSSGGLLERFSPGKFLKLGSFSNSKRLEALAKSREQLIPLRGEPIEAAAFEEMNGVLVLDDGKSMPLITRRAFGLGQVVFVGFDLDSQRMSQWKGLPNLMLRLVGGEELQKEDENKNSSRGSSVSHMGYDDLVGQMRVPMETFSGVRFVAFTWVALLIGLYILCIGPGDYFFLRKILGKMELTWITFPLVSLAFCALAIGISRMTRPTSIQINQFEVIDVDAVAKRVRGSVWANIYSPQGMTCEVELERETGLGFEIDSDLISWHGLPGDGLGGMWTSVNPGLLKTQYRSEIDVSANGRTTKTRLIDLPFQDSSTKPMFSRWWADSPDRIRSRLKKDTRLGGQLVGTVTNPFDFTLTNCKLVFENWVYVLNDDLEPGQTFDVQTETNEKTLKSLLTRRKKNQEDKNRSNNSPWDPEDDKLTRIADMLMFYSAAGGENYTGLTHNYQPFIDMTEYAYLERAVLVGQVKQVGSRLKVNGESADDLYDQTLTIVRLAYPVEYNERKKSR